MHKPNNTTKNQRPRSIIAALALTSLPVLFTSTITTLPTESLAATITTKQISQGTTVFALFFSSDESGCLFRQTQITANTFKSNTAQTTPSTSAFVFISESNSCIADGFRFATGSLDNVDFIVAPSFRGATLHATIPVQEFPSGNTYSLAVDMSWNEDGSAPTRQRSHNSSHSPGTILLFKGSGIGREANATGTVLDGVIDWSPGQSFDAGMQSVTQGSLSVIKN